MKLLYCNTCRDIVKLSRTTRTCHCGATGGHYREDGLNAIYYGPAIPLGFANSEFHTAIEGQPEYGDGYRYTSFVIPKVCPTMVHIDLLDYTEVFDIEEDEYSVDIMMVKAEEERKRVKIKNVFKDEK
tara:strand:- start:2182 stop:2565 length:384 start_codon:yes stop_codon:yes gene_type:complete